MEELGSPSIALCLFALSSVIPVSGEFLCPTFTADLCTFVQVIGALLVICVHCDVRNSYT